MLIFIYALHEIAALHALWDISLKGHYETHLEYHGRHGPPENIKFNAVMTN